MRRRNSTSAIEQFMANFRKERDFYASATGIAHDICEGIVRSNAIRAIVTSRVKRIDRLEEKLLKRNERKKYRNVEEIRDDIPDLAGIRIALYFPGDIERMCTLVEENFLVVGTKKFPKDGNRAKHKTYEPRFEGYKANHF